MTRTYVFFGLVTAFGATMFACSDDETATTATTSNTTTTGTTTATTGTGGTGGGTTATTGTGGTGGTGGMANGGGGTGGTSAADIFCDEYETTCDFAMANRFESHAACVAYFEAADVACQTYMTTHLALAAGAENPHCGHACGNDSAACDPVGCQ